MKKLMIKFHGGIRLTTAECGAIEDYLFGGAARPPLADEGVRKTVNYLKNLCTRSGYRSLDELLQYYADLRATAKRTFDEIRQRTNN